MYWYQIKTHSTKSTCDSLIIILYYRLIYTVIYDKIVYYIYNLISCFFILYMCVQYRNQNSKLKQYVFTFIFILPSTRCSKTMCRSVYYRHRRCVAAQTIWISTFDIILYIQTDIYIHIYKSNNTFENHDISRQHKKKNVFLAFSSLPLPTQCRRMNSTEETGFLCPSRL